MSQRGRLTSAVADFDALRQAGAAQGGDATMAPQGLSFGKMVDGGFAGKLAAQYRKVALTAAVTYNVPHDLGFIPAWFMLVAQTNSNSPANYCWAAPYEYEKWTASEIRIRVGFILGGLAGTEMWLLIGGER